MMIVVFVLYTISIMYNYIVQYRVVWIKNSWILNDDEF